jgi:hypothetical protein
MKNLWQKFVEWFLTKPWAWFLTKPWAWLMKNWFIIINYIVILLAYDNIYGKNGVVFAEVLLGLWIFASVGYAGWKWFNKPNV